MPAGGSGPFAHRGPQSLVSLEEKREHEEGKRLWDKVGATEFQVQPMQSVKKPCRDF